MHYGYLGPAGTFTEEAALRYFQESDLNGVPFNSNLLVVEAVAEGRVEEGIIAIENSFEGTVNESIDTLLRYQDLWIVGETQIPIRHHLIGLPGSHLNNIRRVISHPQALAQCREWLTKNLPDATYGEASSTAQAVQDLIGNADPDTAVIANRRAADVYGGELLKESIHSNTENVTRFVTVSRREADQNGEKFKTSIAFSTHRDQPGSLVDALFILKGFGINLTKIESRPSKKTLGDYLFLVDFNGHYRDPKIAFAMHEMQKWTTQFRVIGSYSVGPLISNGSDEI